MNKSEIEGRLDPMMILYNQKVKSYSHPAKPVKNFLLSKPQYGAAESGIFRTDVNQMRYIRITDIDEYGYLIDEMGVSADISPLEQHKYLLKNNDILLARSGATVGKCYIHKSTEVQYPCTFAGYLIRLRFDENIILPDYFFIITQLNIYKDWVKAIQRVTAQPNINADEYGNFPLPIMPIDKQKEIINIFHKSMLKRKSKLIQSQTLLNSISDYLLEQLGIIVPSVDNSLSERIFVRKSSDLLGSRWDAENKQGYYRLLYQNLENGQYPTVSLGSLIEFIESGARPSGGISNISEGILSLGGEHISQEMNIEIRTPKFISIDFHQKHLVTETQLNDVLLVKDGATTGKVAIVENTKFIGQNINEHLFMMRFSRDVNPYFVLYFLYSAVGQAQIQHGITGATVTGITKSAVKNIKIPLPDLPTQKSIVQHINQIRQQAQALEQEAIDLLKQTQDEIEMMILQ